jgi:hypothetical protein
MALTIVVLSGGADGAPELSLTLDSPRVVVGRGEGCEVRLPDPSVAARHASIRQRGGEYVVLDEGSKNGTFLGPVRLPPQTPRVVRHGERVRVGRVWLELRMEPAIVKGSPAAAARELALALVARGLGAQGELSGPHLSVLEGPDAGLTLPLDEPARRYAVGRVGEADLGLGDPVFARRHLSVTRRGDALSLRVEGAGPPVLLGDEALTGGEAPWRAGQALSVGETLIGYDYPAVRALAEIERSAEEVMPDDEAPSPPAGPAEEDSDEPAAAGAPKDATPTPAPAGLAAEKRAAEANAGWSPLDSVVVILAIGVLALSVLGGFWLLGR